MQKSALTALIGYKAVMDEIPMATNKNNRMWRNQG